jgi:hypothetical protein
MSTHWRITGSVQCMEFLWVRWFGIELGYRLGSCFGCLPKVGFVPDTDISAFGFLDPSLVLCGCHLVPAFASGQTSALLCTISLTLTQPPDETDDWTNYYVIMYVLLFILLHVIVNCTQTDGLIITCSCVTSEVALAMSH